MQNETPSTFDSSSPFLPPNTRPSLLTLTSPAHLPPVPSPVLGQFLPIQFCPQLFFVVWPFFGQFGRFHINFWAIHFLANPFLVNPLANEMSACVVCLCVRTAPLRRTTIRRSPYVGPRAHLRVAALRSTTKFHEKLQERERGKKKENGVGEGKERNFGLPPFRPPFFFWVWALRRLGPPFGVPP